MTNPQNNIAIKKRLERIIGLQMYDRLGIHLYGDLPVLFCNLPKEMGSNKYNNGCT